MQFKSGEGPMIVKKTPSKRKRGTVVMEYSGDLITSNYWVKVGLTRNQVRALKALARKWNCRESPCAGIARHLVSLALIHIGDTERKMAALLKYIEAEGFHSLGSYCERAITLTARNGR
jgi:hypothetical protein